MTQINKIGCKDYQDIFYCFDCRWRDDPELCLKFTLKYNLESFIKD